MSSLAERYDRAFTESLGSPEAVEAHDAVIDALQHFGTVTGALAGSNVVEWFKEKSDAAERAGRQALNPNSGGERE